MYMLHNGPYRAQVQSAPRQTPPRTSWLRQLLMGYAVVLKAILVLCVTTVFFQVTTFLLSLSSSDWVQMLVLAVWACGLIPLVYALWQVDLKPQHLLPNVVARNELPHSQDLG